MNALEKIEAETEFKKWFAKDCKGASYHSAYESWMGCWSVWLEKTKLVKQEDVLPWDNHL